ncbi:hypothetical protein QQ045_017950 [Rhodiola kirilowii]
MSDISDDSGEYMATLTTLDNPIRDEYDRDAMEDLDNVADEYPDAEEVQDRIVWDHPSFTDISAWEIYQPTDENVRVHHPNSPDLGEGSLFASKENVMLAAQRYSILNRVEFKFIAREMRNVMDANTKFSAGQIRNIIQRDYGYEISYWKTWKAQQKALVYLFGKWDESFNKLPHLMQALQDSSNDKHFIKWDVTPLDDGTMQVNRIFWAFSECIKAFEHCRPILSVDGTHMYGKYNAKLLIAIGLDANNGILPLGFALVESENNSSWKWFMSCIREGVTQRVGLCVVSDRHAGILAAMREPEWKEPMAYHRVCVRHVQSNFMTKVKDEVLKAQLGEVAFAKKQIKFVKKFGELLELLNDKPAVRKWLVDMNKEIWTQAYDQMVRKPTPLCHTGCFVKTLGVCSQQSNRNLFEIHPCQSRHRLPVYREPGKSETMDKIQQQPHNGVFDRQGTVHPLCES